MAKIKIQNKILIIASDGGAVRNKSNELGFDASYGFVVREVENIEDKGWMVKNSFENSDFLPNSTNNMGELRGYQAAIRYVLDGAIPITVPILFVLDSEYALNCVNKWYKAWKKTEEDGIAYRNDWKHKKKIPVKNWELIKETKDCLDKLIEKGYQVKSIHVHSHIKETAYASEMFRVCTDSAIEIAPQLFNIIIDANDSADDLCSEMLE